MPLFDIDEIVGEVGTPENPETPVKEVEKATAELQPSRFDKRLRAPASPNTLYFDLETVPDYSREPLFDLPPIPEVAVFKLAVYSDENDGPAPSVLIRGTEEEVKAEIAKAQSGGKLLPRVILDAALNLEAKSEKPKPRKGVMSLLTQMISTIDNEAATIQTAKETNQKAIEDAIAHNRKTMSVTPEMCRICSFGWAMGDEVPMASVFGAKDCTTDHDTYERAVLTKFWDLAKRAKLIVGYNHLGFDLPVIYVRSALLGVTPTRLIDQKPWGGEVCDVYAIRWPKGKPLGGEDASRKLKDTARLMGFPIPAGDVDGSQVEALLKTDPFKVGEYNRSDVSITREIHLMLKGFWW